VNHQSLSSGAVEDDATAVGVTNSNEGGSSSNHVSRVTALGAAAAAVVVVTFSDCITGANDAFLGGATGNSKRGNGLGSVATWCGETARSVLKPDEVVDDDDGTITVSDVDVTLFDVVDVDDDGINDVAEVSVLYGRKYAATFGELKGNAHYIDNRTTHGNSLG
jgi:hypothetical protein